MDDFLSHNPKGSIFGFSQDLRFRFFATNNALGARAAAPDQPEKLKKSSDLRRRSNDRGRRARPARARSPETPRWVGGRTSPRAPPSRRRSAEKVTRATAWCVPPGRLARRIFPCDAPAFSGTAPASRGCRRVRRDASRIATPSARTRARDSLTARMRAGAEGFPRDWRASGAPERARGTRRRFLVLRLDVRRAPSDSTSRVSSV